MEKKLENGPPPPPSSVGDYDDSQSTFTVDQPPPAYRKPDLPAVKMTKIVAATILIVTFIAGVTAVAIVYMQHNLKCSHLAAMQEFSNSGMNPELPQAAKVVQEGEESTTSASSTPTTEEKNTVLPDLLPAEAENQLKKLSFPIHIDMDDITGRMMEKNQRARLNCVIEKKRSEEIIPRAPKTLQTPFGNLTTDPKFTHITGETMSLTCRSGNERVSRPVNEKPAPSPILIQIPIQRGIPVPPPSQPATQVKASQSPPSPVLRPQPIQQQQPQPPAPQHQAAPSHQVNIQGPIPLHPQGLPPLPEPQHHRMLNPFQQLRIPFVPLPQFPQIPLRDVIPHLLDIHKQIQQQRLEEEQQQQQRRNKMQQRPEQRNRDDDDVDDGSDEDDHVDNMMHSGSHESQPQGRALPLHEIPLQRIQGPHPFMPMPHPNQPPQQHLRPEHQQQLRPDMQRPIRPEMPQHLRPDLPHQIRPEPVGLHPQQKPVDQHHPQQQQQQQHQQHPNSQDEERHPGGPEGHLEGAPSFHNMPQVVPTEMMMERAGPLPFIIGSHNMQPRSSARPRMKRMAGACSCVCK